MVATEEEVDLGRAGTDGFWWDVQRLSYCFYVDDGILASPRATYLHRAFESLTELFTTWASTPMLPIQREWIAIYAALVCLSTDD